MDKIYFICSDIHAYFSIWMNTLSKNGFDINNPNHIIITCGDLLDRGDEPKETLSFVCKLLDLHRIICIKGNHEKELQDCIDRKGFNLLAKNIGIYNTAIMLNDMFITNSDDEIISAMSNNSNWQKYYNSLLNYYETNNYIFVHGWIPCFTDNQSYRATQYNFYPDWRNANKLQWSNAYWYNGIDAYNQNVKEDKIIVCGHVNTKTTNIYNNKNMINIDATVYKSKQINILTLNGKDI